MRLPPSGNGHDQLTQAGPLTRIAVRVDNRFLFLATADIRWLEARGNYVRLHTPDGMYHLRASLGALLQRLDPDLFMRVHRSLAANVTAICEIRPNLSGRHVVILSDGSHITTSRSYRHEMRRLLYNRR